MRIQVKPSVYIGATVSLLSITVGLLQAQSQERLNAVQVFAASALLGSLAGFAAEAINKSAPGSDKRDISDKPLAGQSVEVNSNVFSGIFDLPDEALEKAASAVALHEVAVGGASIQEATDFIRTATQQRPTLSISAPSTAQSFAYAIEEDFAEPEVEFEPPPPPAYGGDWEEDLWGDDPEPPRPRQEDEVYTIDGLEI